MKAFLGSFLLLVLSSCAETTSPEQLVERNGVVFKDDTNEPFTGVSIEAGVDGSSELRRVYDAGRVTVIARYKDGRAFGVWDSFFENGQLEFTRNFNEYGMDGPYKWFYPNGQLKKEGSYTDDVLQGSHKEYFENGQLKVEGSYLDGNKNGKWKEYGPDGTLVSTVDY